MKFHAAQQAVSPVVAVVLLVAIAVTLAAVVAVTDFGGIRKNLEREANEPVPDSGFYAQHEDAYLLEPLGPEAIPLIGSRLLVTADGVASVHEVAALAPQLPAGALSWQPGQVVCIAGPDPGCLVGPAQTVAVTVVSGRGIVAELPSLPAPLA